MSAIVVQCELIRADVDLDCLRVITEVGGASVIFHTKANILLHQPPVLQISLFPLFLTVKSVCHFLIHSRQLGINTTHYYHLTALTFDYTSCAKPLMYCHFWFTEVDTFSLIPLLFLSSSSCPFHLFTPPSPLPPPPLWPIRPHLHGNRQWG